MVRWLIAIFVCISVIGGLGFIKFTQVKAAIAFGESFPEASETVETISSTVTLWQPSVDVIGEVVAPQTIVLRNELEGIVRAVNFQSGGAVNAGTVILQLDIRDELARLDGINAEIRLAELEVARLERLLSAKAGSKDQVDRAKAQLDVAKAQKLSLEALISRKSIVAPFSGVAGLHQLEVGQFLTSNSMITELIGDTSNMWIDFALPQQYARIAEQQPIQVHSIDNSFNALKAKVIAQGKRLATQSRSLQVRAMVENDNAILTAGEVVSVTVPIAVEKAVIALPVTAVRQDSFGSYVFILDKDDNDTWRAQRRAVEVIHRTATEVMVSEKLGAGLTVATTGSYKLKSGLLTYVKGA